MSDPLDPLNELFADLIGKNPKQKDAAERLRDALRPDNRNVSANDPRTHQATDILVELTRDTADVNVQDANLRALAVYRSIVRHVLAGGTVKFVSADGTEKTLKIRLRGT